MDASNVRAVCDLELAPGQEYYVAPAAHTVAEAQFDPRARLRVIYRGEEPVGLVALESDPELGFFKLVRVMVDASRQGRGIGRRAVELVADELRSQGAEELFTCYRPGPDDPRGFYLAVGFEDTGRESGGEPVLRLALNDRR